jgi:hypothetical protein
MDFRDLAVAARTLRKSPVFAFTAALTIALGVGASTAIFSVTKSVLLRPLPYRDPDRVVVACSDWRKRNVRDFPLSNANFIDLREGTKSVFDDLAGVFTFPLTLQHEDGTPEQTNAAVVTTNFFRVLGGGVAYGRDFNDADAVPNPSPPPPGTQQQGPQPARLPVHAILSYEYFRRRYSGDPAVIGRSMSIAGPQAPTPIIAVSLNPAYRDGCPFASGHHGPTGGHLYLAINGLDLQSLLSKLVGQYTRLILGTGWLGLSQNPCSGVKCHTALI